MSQAGYIPDVDENPPTDGELQMREAVAALAQKQKDRGR